MSLYQLQNSQKNEPKDCLSRDLEPRCLNTCLLEDSASKVSPFSKAFSFEKRKEPDLHEYSDSELPFLKSKKRKTSVANYDMIDISHTLPSNIPLRYDRCYCGLGLIHPPPEPEEDD